MRKRAVACLLATSMLATGLPMVAFAAQSTDIYDMPDNYASTSLENAVASGLLEGADGQIRPYDNLTRAEMAAVLARVFDTTEMADLSGYADVDEGAWYYQSLAKMVALGIFEGYDGMLYPNAPITREQVFAVLARAFGLASGEAIDLIQFGDFTAISSWAIPEVSAMVNAGFVQGYTQDGMEIINPTGSVTRQDFAVVIDRLMQAMDDADTTDDTTLDQSDDTDDDTDDDDDDSASSSSSSDRDRDNADDDIVVPIADAIIAKPMTSTLLTLNEYLATGEACIHNDIYNSDVTAYAMPLGIYTEVQEGTADAGSLNSPPAFFYDSYGNAIAPYSQQVGSTITSGGVAIMDMDSDDELTVLGSYLPDTYAGGIQISYSFVDANSYLVGPTVGGGVKYIQTVDDGGAVLEDFTVVLDVDLLTAVNSILGQSDDDTAQKSSVDSGDGADQSADTVLNPNGLDVNILSIAYDYDGNLWFASGGFLMDPTNAEAKQGFVGYLEQDYIADNLGDSTPADPKDSIHVMAFTTPTVITDDDGNEVTLYAENVENGIAAHEAGCVVLTNQQCYLFSADDNEDNGIKVEWSVPYESVGRKVAEDDGTDDGAGAGLAWGGGSSPTLTDDLVLFTDNLDVINLYAVDIQTGDVVVKTPVLDFGETVSLENSVCVYADDEKTSVLLCNWLGAGKNDIVDSSVQTYDALYDSDWRTYGAEYLTPGVERVDILQDKRGNYYAESIWLREDLKDTSMIKLATGVGYYYGYVQDDDGMWGFIALDYDTGETVLWVPVSDEDSYNNIAVGIVQGSTGNVIYCPTNSKTLVSIRDRFAYLPSNPELALDITTMSRAWLTEDDFDSATPVTMWHTVDIAKEDVQDALDDAGNLQVAFRVNGLSGYAQDYSAYTHNGIAYAQVNFTLTDENGREIAAYERLQEGSIYEVRITVSVEDNTQTVGMVLAH